MTNSLSTNTQAILLLTAPLFAGNGASSQELLSPGEYKRLARHLREVQRQPADLFASDGGDLLRSCRLVVEESRMQRLLGRGFLLSQAVERWQARAIAVLSRADAEYPRRLKARLREDAPAVLYACGDLRLLESGGLAVIGSRDVDDALIDYTMNVGRLAARAGKSIVSGGAKGIDQAAMRGALEAGGKVSGVLSDSLEKTAMNREHRTLLIEGQLVLISPYDPGAGFNVGNAMQRNKLIYALADASLVVSSDVKKGGTWTGAVEQLDKLRFVPVYVRSTGESSPGLDALRKKGAILWPNPQDPTAFDAIFNGAGPTSAGVTQAALSLFSGDDSAGRLPNATTGIEDAQFASKRPKESLPTPEAVRDPHQMVRTVKEASKTFDTRGASQARSRPLSEIDLTPAEAVFGPVREIMRHLLKFPRKDAEVAAMLDVTTAQAKAWLQRLVAEGEVEKLKKPVRYVAKL